MNKLLLCLVLLFSGTVFAQVCTRGQSTINFLLGNKSSRIAFRNSGGLIDGGVCWWHARLQRSSVYLTTFDPQGPRPEGPVLDKILHSLRVMDRPQIISGYSDFESFSRDYKNEIQDMLEDWQRRDGFFNFEWIRGISGNYQLQPGRMRSRMEDVYRFFKISPRPIWVMAQIKGITSHSLLILNMEETEIGYDLYVIDSNHPADTIRISYVNGDRSLKHDGYTFVPYVGFQNDFRLIAKALQSQCGSSLTESENIPLGDVELNLQ